jgi:hypothetical protein
MTDEDGNRSFDFPGRVAVFEDIVPDFDRIDPAYFRSLDRKMRYFSDNGVVPFFESLRRDQGADWFPPGNPTADDWNNALTARLKTYGPMPFGQPTSTNIATST